MEALPMSFNGRDDNPWEFSDIVFHVPFYQEVRPAGHAAHGDGDEFCCFGHDSGKAPTTLWGRIFGSQGKKEGKTAGVCFAREAVTICVFNHDEYEKQHWQHKRAMSLSSNWTALVVDPRDIFKFTDDKHSQRFVDGILPPSARNSNREAKHQWTDYQNADFFQTRLIQIALKHITDEWQESIVSIDDVCNNFEKNTRKRMEDPSYWRGEVNGTLIQAHKISRGLEILQQSIRNIIEDKENQDMDYGVWRRFRNARPRRRMGDLENLQKASKEEVPPKPLGIGEEKNRLKHILWDICDIYQQRLFSVQARLRARREAVDSLRGLV
ncbi:hypothetical protein BFW01_g265 [Lasiodiplodia theobromae]|uniref:Uncharacterized protein n=2 Tax=Lasiodiplodia theobromae TaxID=45133 RepID=A0A8H7MB60_9PEZI|nr:hypothetical protein BFW01_g265 [Lasiodiplodia theobromae]